MPSWRVGSCHESYEVALLTDIFMCAIGIARFFLCEWAQHIFVNGRAANDPTIIAELFLFLRPLCSAQLTN